jgi:hypothetical protein
MKRHSFDPLSFSFGIALAAIAVVLSVADLSLHSPGLRWIAAGFLLVFGILLIVTTRTNSRDDR